MDSVLENTSKEVDGPTSLLVVLSIVVRLIPLSLICLILLSTGTDVGYHSSGYYYFMVAIFVAVLLPYSLSLLRGESEFIRKYSLGVILLDILMFLILIEDLYRFGEINIFSVVSLMVMPAIFAIFQLYVAKRLDRSVAV